MQTNQIINLGRIRGDFPILKKGNLIYLDSSATSLTPKIVIDAMSEYYENYNSNVHRGIYPISQKATEEYELAHKKIADLINAEPEEIIFTKNTTESLNLLAYSLMKKLNKGDRILLTEMEHHSNLVPWQQLAKEKGIFIDYIGLKEDWTLDVEKIEELITEKTKIVSVVHMSNVLGAINDVRKIAKIVHKKNALFIVDGAQSVPHFSVDVKELDCDFLAFSGHKMLGPTGIGVLYGKRKILESMEPFLFGGDMILEVSYTDSVWNELPWKFEAGTPNIAEAIGLGKAVDYTKNIGIENIKDYEEYLTKYAIEKLSQIKGLVIYGPSKNKERGSVISFNVNDIHPHDVSAVLGRLGIAIRGGHMCAMPLIRERMKLQSVCRVSLYFYNTTEEIDKLADGIKKVIEVFSR